MEISKELFIAVRGSFNKEIFELILKGNSIEVNSFFFDCKEWALAQYNVKIKSTTYMYGGEVLIENPYNPSQFEKIIKADSEHRAVFDACEWVLYEKHLQH